MATEWQHSESFAERNLKMFESEALCDVTFAFGEDEKHIKCHKFLLASRSPVFYAMFCGPLAETNNFITITDSDASAFKAFIRYLYSDQVDITPDEVLHLMYVAKKYDVPSLESKCTNYLKSNITPEIVCIVLDQAIVYDDFDLKQKCLNFIMQKSNSVLKSEAFVDMSRKGLKLVLECNNFAASEGQLFHGCTRWARNVCMITNQPTTDENVRTVLGEELIRLIRFPAMSLQEFTDFVAAGEILSKSEMVDIYRSIINKENVSSYNHVKRNYVIDNVLFQRCIQVDKGDPYRKVYDEPLYFSVSVDCTLCGLAMFLPAETGGAVTGSISIFEGRHIIYDQLVNLRYMDGKQYEVVSLNKHIPLTMSKTYHISHCLMGSATFVCKTPITEISQYGVTVRFSNTHVTFESLSNPVRQYFGLQLVCSARD